jgi:hypothetical protein
MSKSAAICIVANNTQSNASNFLVNVLMKTKTAAALRIPRLYHYQKFDKPERLARIFTDGTLYFSNTGDFNDPWDCRPFYSKAELDDPDEYERAVRWLVQIDRKYNSLLPEEEHTRREREVRANRKLLEWMIDELTRTVGATIEKQYRVYCLSTHPDSTLMWAHYAASCKGLCLEFSVRNDLFCAALAVEYPETYPSFEVAETDEDQNLRPLLTKSSVWRYEDEFRVLATEHPVTFPDVPITKEGFLPFPKRALQSVIIGAKMPPFDRELVQALVAKSGQDIELKIAALIPNRYALEIGTFDS